MTTGAIRTIVTSPPGYGSTIPALSTARQETIVTFSFVAPLISDIEGGMRRRATWSTGAGDAQFLDSITLALYFMPVVTGISNGGYA